MPRASVGVVLSSLLRTNVRVLVGTARPLSRKYVPYVTHLYRTYRGILAFNPGRLPCQIQDKVLLKSELGR